MDALTALHSRVSVPAKTLVEPAPGDADLERILAAAVTGPDHGGLRPWRFILVRGPARERLAEVFAEALLKRQPDADGERLERERGKPLRAPALLVVVARVTDQNPKVPEVEQLMSAAAAASHILVAAHALGYGAVWYTGDSAYDWNVAAPLGLDLDEKIVAFIYLGTPSRPPVPKERPDPLSLLQEWEGPAAGEREADI